MDGSDFTTEREESTNVCIAATALVAVAVGVAAGSVPDISVLAPADVGVAFGTLVVMVAGADVLVAVASTVGDASVVDTVTGRALPRKLPCMSYVIRVVRPLGSVTEVTSLRAS